MNGIGLAVWIGAASLLPLRPGDHLDTGLYSASRVLDAYAIVDERPQLYEHPSVLEMPVWMHRRIELNAESKPVLAMALLTAGLHLVDTTADDRQPAVFVTRDPARRPQKSLGYDVDFVEVTSVDPVELAKKLMAEVAKLEKGLPQNVLRTRVVGDPRSHKLIIRFTSKARLVHYKELAHRLDQPPPRSDRPILKSFVCQHTRAVDVAKELREQWPTFSKVAIRIVPHAKSNTVLIRAPSHVWPDIKAVLLELDRPKKIRAPR